MALFLACWRWLMPLARGIEPPPHPVLSPVAAPLAPARHPDGRLALLHAPPLRLLT